MTVCHSETTMQKRREYDRQYHIKNKELIAATKKLAKKKNIIYYKKYLQDYYSTITGRANRMFHGAKRRAKVKNLEFMISLDDVKNALIVGKCQKTNIEFELCSEASPFAPSIDRIESDKGYTPDNVQYVCCAYNLGKQHMSDEKFKEFILTAAKFMSMK